MTNLNPEPTTLTQPPCPTEPPGRLMEPSHGHLKEHFQKQPWAARIRFQFALLLYLGWLGYLAWQVAITRIPGGPTPVLSRSQWAGSDAEVLGKITGPDELEIVDILYAPKDLKLAKGKWIIGGLDNAQKAPPKTVPNGEETWLVPLRKVANGFMVAPLPSGPGFRAGPLGEDIGRIYLFTEKLRFHAKMVRKEVFPESIPFGKSNQTNQNLGERGAEAP